MLGRGVDQILPHPGNPTLYERQVADARTYVELAIRANGSIPQPVDWSWPWGDALQLLAHSSCDARIVNLETSITTSDDYVPGKAVHYRMNPANSEALAAVRPDACVLANNHVLDFGRRGLLETLDVLSRSGLAAVGAGRSLREAQSPVIMPIPRTGGRILVFAFGSPSSGIPYEWAATDSTPGVHVITTLSDGAADRLCHQILQVRQPGDLTVVSAHWGSNWGYRVAADHVRFAHRLVDGGVDLVHGHSSHHPRPIEVYRGKLILYGCGDLVDDYEGIRGTTSIGLIFVCSTCRVWIRHPESWWSCAWSRCKPARCGCIGRRAGCAMDQDRAGQGEPPLRVKNRSWIRRSAQPSAVVLILI